MTGADISADFNRGNRRGVLFMIVVVAPDKFRGSLSALEAARAMGDGVKTVDPSAVIRECPMADGGEGTLEVIAMKTGAGTVRTRVHGPLPGTEVQAAWAQVPPDGLSGGLCRGGERYTFSPDGSIAFIEMSQASGLSLMPTELRSPLKTTTLGTGDLIKEALDAGCRQLVVGLGGSGTVDCGLGVASRLGYRFLDSRENELFPCGESLERVQYIDDGSVDPRVRESKFVVASDVDNPLAGPCGAARVYGPQKGASADEVETLERGLLHFGRMLNSLSGRDVVNMPGAGAAGGLGAGMVAFCGARIVMGAEFVASLTGLKGLIEGADLVLTGEGAFDYQSERGKVPFSVAAMAAEHGVPTVVLAGKVLTGRLGELNDKVGVFGIVPGPMDEEEAMTNAEKLLREGTARLIRIIGLFESSFKNSEEVSGGQSSSL
ncbi:MAG: glycerate kinase [Actinobacteria bacterium]|nr:glycerate kinase [Actinomycetota bacterium]